MPKDSVVWVQLCEEYDRGLLNGDDLRFYAKRFFPKTSWTAVDATIRQLEANYV